MIDTGAIEQEQRHILDAHIEGQISNNISRGSNYASDLGWECDTYQALCRLKGHLKPKKTISQEKLFRIGRELELPNIRLLQDARIKAKPANDKKYEWKKFNIVGYLDATIKIGLLKRYIPLEHKACSPHVFENIKRYKRFGIPLMQAKQLWLRKYPAQLMIYMLLIGEEYGMWFFFNSSYGEYFFWLLALDYQYAEACLQRAERANENAAKNHIPKPEEKELCNKCDFAHTYCFPGKDYGPGYIFMTAGERERKLERWWEIRDVGKEYKVEAGERSAFKIIKKHGLSSTSIKIEKIGETP